MTSFCGYAIGDVLLQRCLPRLDGKGRYWALHVLANMYVVRRHAKDLVTAYSNPIDAAFGPEPDTKALMAVIALHVFHALRYKLDRVDWLHHVVMIAGLAPLGLVIKGSSLLGHALFWSTGLPGMIDYAMLVAVRLGLFRSVAERKMNALINVWMRSPGMLMHAFLSFVALLQTRHGRSIQGCVVPHRVQPYAAAFISIASMWNGQYFMARVLRSAARK